VNTPLLLQWRNEANRGWYTVECSGIPLAFPVAVRIDFTHAVQLQGVLELIRKIKEIVGKVQGTVGTETVSDSLVEPEEGDSLLEVMVSDGRTSFAMETRWQRALEGRHHTWVLPMMPAPPVGSTGTLPEPLRAQNIAFWHNSIEELALTALARAGVTSLDRQVFISYRRVDTEPMAQQLRVALEARNFGVFLDTVSVDPGINFQASLFEQLNDKSMVLMLHSNTFSKSRWTMAEFTYVKEHDLSLLVLRQPSLAAGDPLEQQYRAGDVIRLADEDLETVPPNTVPTLTQAALTTVVTQIIEQHDLEMVERLASLRQRTLNALQANQVRHHESIYGASILAESDAGGRTYRLFPASRPPGLPELFDASTFVREQGDRRIVIGNISAFNEERVRQMDWTVDQRNVTYADVSMIDSLAKEIKLGKL
jgi:hypothetical protein